MLVPYSNRQWNTPFSPHATRKPSASARPSQQRSRALIYLLESDVPIGNGDDAQETTMLDRIKSTLKLRNPDLLREQAYINGEWVSADDGATFD